jgi:hypothetical protein
MQYLQRPGANDPWRCALPRLRLTESEEKAHHSSGVLSYYRLDETTLLGLGNNLKLTHIVEPIWYKESIFYYFGGII